MMPVSYRNPPRCAASDAEQKRIQLVTFRLDRHQFAVAVEQVWRVEALTGFTITRVPGAVPYLEGLIHLHGRVIPVIDLKKRLGLAPDIAAPDPAAARAAYPVKARLLIVEMEIVGQKDEKVAMIVDTVNDIRWFAAASLHAPPLVTEISREYLLGVLDEDGQLWIVLDLRQVLSTEERHVLRSEAEKDQSDRNDSSPGDELQAESA